ncbi:MAG: hypothetical protein ACRDRY_18885 [Pseudonocardiaceae bacterium]
MSDPQRHKGRVQVVTFTVTCSPGRQAAAGVRQIGPGWISLVLSMDPGRVVIDVPSVSGGAAVLARFCRELAREASRLAADLDPGQAITTGGTS